MQMLGTAITTNIKPCHSPICACHATINVAYGFERFCSSSHLYAAEYHTTNWTVCVSKKSIQALVFLFIIKDPASFLSVPCK